MPLYQPCNLGGAHWESLLLVVFKGLFGRSNLFGRKVVVKWGVWMSDYGQLLVIRAVKSPERNRAHPWKVKWGNLNGLWPSKLFSAPSTGGIGPQRVRTHQRIAELWTERTNGMLTSSTISEQDLGSHCWRAYFTLSRAQSQGHAFRAAEVIKLRRTCDHLVRLRAYWLHSEVQEEEEVDHGKKTVYQTYHLI